MFALRDIARIEHSCRRLQASASRPSGQVQPQQSKRCFRCCQGGVQSYHSIWAPFLCTLSPIERFPPFGARQAFELACMSAFESAERGGGGASPSGDGKMRRSAAGSTMWRPDGSLNEARCYSDLERDIRRARERPVAAPRRSSPLPMRGT